MTIDIIDKNLNEQNCLLRFLKGQPDVNPDILAMNLKEYLSKRYFGYSAPDVLLLDIDLACFKSMSGITQLLQRLTGTKLVAYTGCEDEKRIFEAMYAGLSSFISKKMRLQDVVNGIKTTAQGGCYLSPSIAEKLFSPAINSHRLQHENQLSLRQRQIIKRLAEGKSYPEIGRELFLSPETIKSHIKKMYRILNVKNKIQAVSWYLDAIPA